MALATVGLKTAIWNNNLRSMMLLAAYPLLLAALVWAVAALYGAMMGYGMTGPGPELWRRSAAFGAGIVAQFWPTLLAVVGVWFTVSFFFHTKMIRALAHAAPLERHEAPALYNLLENLCISRGLPVPKLQIVETDAMNAFASGIGRDTYAITVTRGLVETLAPDEIEAVLAHELTHIMNNDVRLMIISIIFVGMLGFVSQLLWSQIRWNLYTHPRSRDGRGGQGQFLLFLLAVQLILGLGYITTVITRFALSRHRESMADEGAVELTKNPEAMIRALLRIEGRADMPHASPDIAQMCIENSRPFLGLFSDHPPIAERVRHIAEITGTPLPAPEGFGEPPPEPLRKRKRNPWARSRT